MNRSIQLCAYNCVWVSHYQLEHRTDGKPGRKRVKLAYPKVKCGTVYTLRPSDLSHGFEGWTWDALDRGRPARHYGSPVAVCDTVEECHLVANYLQDWLYRCCEYGHPLVGWSRIQVGWNGVHEKDPVSVERPLVDTSKCAGNLAWCEVSGLRRGNNETCLALVDIESIRGSDPYVDIVCAIGNEYDNCGVYVDMIKHVFNERARKAIISYLEEPHSEVWARSAMEAEAREQMDREDEDARYYAELY